MLEDKNCLSISQLKPKLASMPLFQSLKNQELEETIRDSRCSCYSYKRGQIIHIEGEQCDKAELLLEGEVVIERIGEDGNLMLIARFRSGDILGGNLVFASHAIYPMTITCRADCKLVSIDKELLLDLMHDDRSFLLEYLLIISDNTSLLSGKLRHHVNRSIRDQLLDYIREQVRLQNSNKIKLTMTKTEMAENFGIQRTSLSRELRKMKQAGLVEYDSETITLMIL